MTRDEAVASRDRWRMVAELENKEMREASGEFKLAQLSALMESSELFDTDSDGREVAVVRERWNRLRHLFLDR